MTDSSFYITSRHLLSRLFDYESEQRSRADLFAATSNNYDNVDNVGVGYRAPKSRRSSAESMKGRRSPSHDYLENRNKEKSI